MTNVLIECDGFQGVAGSAEFFQSIRGIRDEVLRDLEKVTYFLGRKVETIRVTCINSEDSYITEAMKSAYQACKLVTNTAGHITTASGRRRSQKSNAHPQRVDIIQQKLAGAVELGEQSVFEITFLDMKTEFEKTLSKWANDQCLPVLRKGNENIFAEFDRRFTVEDEIKQEEDEEAIEQLKNAAELALLKIEEELKPEVEAFEAYEKGGQAL